MKQMKERESVCVYVCGRSLSTAKKGGDQAHKNKGNGALKKRWDLLEEQHVLCRHTLSKLEDQLFCI
jgi:hypothetical protein